MAVSGNCRRGNRGQVLVLAVVVLGLCSSLLMGVFVVSSAVKQKIRLQLTADMAVLSVLNHQADALNSIALANRAILANDALAAQLNALACESRFYRKFAERFQEYLKFVPWLGPALTFISRGARTMELAVKRAASCILPLCRAANTLMGQSQSLLRKILPASSLKVARDSVAHNMPGARIPEASSLLLLSRARQVQEHLEPVPMRDLQAVREATMDSHTLKRNWKVSAVGITPVRKNGGTRFREDDPQAHDRLRVKVLRKLRWRWKTVLSEENAASDLGYRAPDTMMSMNVAKSGVFRLPLAVQWEFSGDLAGKGERTFLAVAAGELYYRRDSKPHETANVFNPFWKSRLIPVAADPAARKIIPGILLEELAH